MEPPPSFKMEPQSSFKIEPEPSFIGPPPMSPMEYDIKVEPGISSPSGSVISQGPPSGPGMITYSQPSPGGYYQDYQHVSQQNAFSNFQSGFINGAYDEQFYSRSAAPSRFHPYGRSPVPTPSPGASGTDVKEERLTPNTPEILDLDSQKVLNSNSTSQDHIESLPSMWRPHEEYPSPNNTSGIICSSSEIGSLNLKSASTGLGPSSTGLRPVSTGVGLSPTGVGLSSSGLEPPITTSVGLSQSIAGHSQTGVAPSNLGSMTPGLGISSGLNIIPPTGLGSTTQMHMLPHLQQSVYGSPHTLTSNHQIISVSNSSGFPSSSSLPSYYSQGLSMNSGITNSSVQFSSTPTHSPSPREPPSNEYPSNVKRAKSFKCEDCNKWFTSHGHLKRHYNTTLHKNMTKLNGSGTSTNTQSTTTDITRPPILSPSSKSIGETSTTSSHDEESNLSTTDPMEHTSNSFQPVGSAFQPPALNASSYSSQNTQFPGSSNAISHINTTHPHYNPSHAFPPEQPLTAPTMYHGHFSTNPTYMPQSSVSGNGTDFFLSNNYMYHPQSGGLYGPGFHSVNEYPGPSPVDGLNSFRLENDRVPHQFPSGNELAPVRISSEEPSGDTGSEASMDSSESSSTGPVDNYKCNDCNKTFNRMCYLTQHRSTYHEGEKPFKCGTCGKRFTDEITFTDHQGKHAGEKPYKCEVCPKQFNHKTDLRRHMCLHTGEKPFSCDQCGKGFIRKDHMLKHSQTHRKKALAAAANTSHTHPSMPPNPPGFTTHPGLHPQTHVPLSHQSHGPSGHPHIVAPTVY